MELWLFDAELQWAGMKEKVREAQTSLSAVIGAGPAPAIWGFVDTGWGVWWFEPALVWTAGTVGGVFGCGGVRVC